MKRFIDEVIKMKWVKFKTDVGYRWESVPLGYEITVESLEALPLDKDEHKFIIGFYKDEKQIDLETAETLDDSMQIVEEFMDQLIT